MSEMLKVFEMQEQREFPRATRPAGFTVSECWGKFLSRDLDNGDHMFGLIDGVRIMIKFDEWENDPDMVSFVLSMAQKAYAMGKKIHLVIDCFNTARGPGDYHARVIMPSMNKMARMISDIIVAFPPLWKIEVFNEPYYCKNASQRINIKQYAVYVQKFIEGLYLGGFAGILVASQSRTDRFWKWPHRDNRIEEGWEWKKSCVWPYGNHEGVHSAVLHEEITGSGVIERISDKWHNGRAIGWSHPIDETEWAVGKRVSTNSQPGYNMTKEVLHFMQGSKCPITILTWGGGHDGFGHPLWPGEMNYVNKHDQLAIGAEAIYDFYGAEMPREGPPPPPPSSYNWDNQCVLAQNDLDKARKRGRGRRGIRSARRVIGHMKNAIGEE